MKATVTIGRQLGCGGSEIGQRIAENLGFRCLDREIVSHTAQHFGLNEAELAAREEKTATFWERMLSGMGVVAPEAHCPAPVHSLSDREIFESETAVMKSIAQQENCVIVGRAASYVLPQHPQMVNIFLYAPLRFRVPRVMEYYRAESEAQAISMIENSDGARKKLIAQMTGRDWGYARNYHLCLDTSALPLDETAEVLTDFVRRRLAAA